MTAGDFNPHSSSHCHDLILSEQGYRPGYQQRAMIV